MDIRHPQHRGQVLRFWMHVDVRVEKSVRFSVVKYMGLEQKVPCIFHSSHYKAPVLMTI